MIKVLIADDQELIRQSLSIILGLKEEISVVGGVGAVSYTHLTLPTIA